MLKYRGRESDARIMASSTYVPAWLRVGIWQFGAAAALAFGGKLLLR